MQTNNQMQEQLLMDSIRDVKDFPKPGVVFKDITTLLNNAEAFEVLMYHLEQRYKSYGLEYIAGIYSSKLKKLVFYNWNFPYIMKLGADK